MGHIPLCVLVVGPGGRGRVSCRHRGQGDRHPGRSRISAATGSEI